MRPGFTDRSIGRTWRVLAAAVVAAVVVLGISPPAALAGGGGGLLKICTTGDYKPLTYRDPATGLYSGVDIEMAMDLASFLGRQPRFVATTWPTLSRDVATPGMCDIAVGGITDTAARREIADFTASYLPSGKVPLVAVANAGRFGTVDQINRPGVRVIENPGGTNEKFARQNFPDAEITIWPDNTTIFGQLVAGHSDVMITDAIEAVYQSNEHPGLVAVNPDHPFTSELKAYMLPKGSPLTPEVDAWLSRALQDGTFNQIYQRWVG